MSLSTKLVKAAAASEPALVTLDHAGSRAGLDLRSKGIALEAPSG
jgi:hypothetical protein